MAQFEGSLRIIGDPGPPVDASVTVTDGRLTMISGDVEIGNWDMDELSILHRLDGYHIEVEGEELVMAFADSSGFAQAIQSNEIPPSPHPEAFIPTSALDPPTTEGHAETKVEASSPDAKLKYSELPVGIRFGAPLTLVLLVVAIFFPGPVGAIFLLSGMLLLLAAALAVMDPVIAARIPAPVTDKHLLVGGICLILVGGIVSLLS
jgi:hypothetical protein